MAVTTRLRGAEALFRAERDLDDVQKRQLPRATREATTTVVDEELPAVVRAFAATTLPKRYAADILPELRFRTVVRLHSRIGTWVTVTVWARGRNRHRDLNTIDLYGHLRHPLFGNRRYWYVTHVEPGFAYRAMLAVRPVLERRIDTEWSKVAARFEATH